MAKIGLFIAADGKVRKQVIETTPDQLLVEIPGHSEPAKGAEPARIIPGRSVLYAKAAEITLTQEVFIYHEAPTPPPAPPPETA